MAVDSGSATASTTYGEFKGGQNPATFLKRWSFRDIRTLPDVDMPASNSDVPLAH